MSGGGDSGSHFPACLIVICRRRVVDIDFPVELLVLIICVVIILISVNYLEHTYLPIVRVWPDSNTTRGLFHNIMEDWNWNIPLNW